MLCKTSVLVGVWAIVLGSALANAESVDYEITQRNLQAHVGYLCKDSLEGRLTGSAGERLAAHYVATFYQQLGLEPAGDHGSYFQAFDFTAGVSLGKNNVLIVTDQQGKGRHLILNKDWRPLAYSNNASFKSNELVLVGYGIMAPAQKNLSAYDSYRHLNVTNKWVVAYREMPETISDARRSQIEDYASLRYKVFAAKERGAKGVIFVSAPYVTRKDELIPLTFDSAIASSGMTVLSVKRQALPLSALNTMSLSGKTDIKKIIHQGYNVLARLKMSPNTSRNIVVSAHLDHLGHGELGGSRGLNNEAGMMHPGADDNASGVASMMEVAAMLSDLKAKGRLQGNKDIVFAAWSGEEFGVLGSSYYVSHLKDSSVEAEINLDMVGHLRDALVLQGAGSSLDWPALIAKVKYKHIPSVITQSDPYLPTDSTPFYLNGIPTLNLFTGAHDDYHTPRDRPETLNYAGIKAVSNMLAHLVLTLERQSTHLSFHEIQKPSNHDEREMQIYLGTIPDYASSDISGVKLSGVAKSSPAEDAGIKRNDVVIRLAGKTIHDIYDYTYALNALSAGVPAKLLVMRSGKQVSLTVVARYRE